MATRSRLESGATVALMRSQAGPGGGTALSVVPTSYLTEIPPHLFRVILLAPPLASTSFLASLPCGRPIDSFGHYRAACARSGVLAEGGSLSKVLLLAFVGRQEDVLGRIV